MKLSKAQQEVMDKAKARIDFARTHSFCDWWRSGASYYHRNKTDEEVYAYLEGREYFNTEEEMKRYEMNRNGIDYLCHASSASIRKLESLGLIEIIKDSCGDKRYGFDTIKILNY